jgi:hypothetical protein
MSPVHEARDENVSDQFIPPFQDLATLARHTCLSERTIENHVVMGIFPAPRMQGRKRLWSWKEVERHLAGVDTGEHAKPVDLVERIRNGTRRAAAGR